MTTAIVIGAIFFVMVLVFGAKFAELMLKLTTASALGACTWFIYGLATGQSSLFAFFFGTFIFFILIELIFGRE